MNISRRQLNLIKQELTAAKPIENDDKLPPQPSILPPLPGDPFVVRNARRLSRAANRLPRVTNRLRHIRPRNIRNRRNNHPARLIQNLSFTQPKLVDVTIVIPVFNKFNLTYQCLLSIKQHVASTVAYEVVIVDNNSTDDTAVFQHVVGLKYIRNAENKGFVEGCNIGASKATGEYLVFLNNDALVTDNWLESLLQTIKTLPNVGLVGSKILYLDGRLQEAGGVIFKDGDGNNYGKNDHPDRYQYNYRRDVDYCSGASIIIRRKLFDTFGGFDMLYAPAYYEDTDLAFKVRREGLRVVYQPQSVIYHIEGATSGTDTTTGFKKYQAINHDKFFKRWKQTLVKDHYSPDNLYLARDRSAQKLLLIIDEHVPTPDKDSGSVRMVRLIGLMQRLGYKITFYPNYTAYRPGYTATLQQQGVEVVYGPIRFDSFIEKYGKYYDAVIMSRPRIASYYMDLCQMFCPKARLIYDTVDLHYLRLRRQAEHETGKLQRYYLDMAAKHEILEKSMMREADTTLVVSSVEAALLKTDGYAVSVLSNIHEVAPAAYQSSYDDRKDLLFIGGFAHLPNIDAVRWFVKQIFPKIIAKNSSIKFHVVGSEMPPDLKDELAGLANVIVHGFVKDLTPILQQARIFIAPLRYGAGVKGKIGQAIEYGIPVVSTTIGLEGMYLKNGESCVAADTAADFAANVLRLYGDKLVWTKIQKNARWVLETHFSAKKTYADLQKILGER